MVSHGFWPTDTRAKLFAHYSKRENVMSTRTLASGFMAGLLAIGTVAIAPASAAELDFNFKVNQGPVGTSFATLSLDEWGPGTTLFSLNTELTGGSGNPGIVELRFGCNGCGAPIFIPVSPGVTIASNGIQAGYDFDFVATFDPSATAGNSPLLFLANSAPSTFLEPTAGAGPTAFALIQLTGGSEVINGENITSGFYVAAVPEPSTYLMMFAGLGMVGLALRRRAHRDDRKKLLLPK